MKKSKYTIFLVILSIVTLLFSAGCTGKEPMSSVDDTQPVIIEQPSEVVSEVVSEVPSEPESEPEPQVDPNEELTWQYLEADEEWLKEIETLVLKRDGKLYTLGNSVPLENWKQFDFGVSDRKRGHTYSKGDYDGERILHDDTFVIPCVSRSDEIAWYGKPVTSVTFTPVAFYGYTVPILQDPNVCKTLTVFDNGKREYEPVNYGDVVVVQYYQEKSTELVDANGTNVLSDFRNLNHGEEYTLKWTEDGNEHEETLIACWRYYKSTGDASIVLTGTTTDDPMIIEYDLSELPPGLYQINETYSLVEIKE